MLALLAPGSASAASATRIIVKREPGLSAAERADIRADAGVRLMRTLSLPRTEVVTTRDPSAALATLRRDRDVVYAEIDHKRRLAAVPNDALWSYLWGLSNVGQSKQPYFYGGLRDADVDAPEAWAQQLAGAAVTGAGEQVAIVDTGIDQGNEDLGGQVFDAHTLIGSAIVEGAPDGNSHGTHVAGTIAALRNNHKGVAGIAPDAKLMALKAFDDDGTGWDSDIADAIHYAAAGDVDRDPVPIVNLSLGGTDPSPTINDAIRDAPDTLFVAAAGNSGTDNDTHVFMPCNSEHENVICVGASTNRDRRATFSNYGDQTVDLFAPGQDIASTIPYATYPDDPTFYGVKDGTSMAAPHVAAAAALVMQAAPTLSVADVKQVLLESVDKRAAFTGYSVTGGRLNAGAAVAYALAYPAVPPDGDGDGVFDAIDACPDVKDSGPEGCAPGDADQDGRVDTLDNCPGDANVGWADTDLDGDGNVCDADRDGDGVPNTTDQCPDTKGPAPTGCPPKPKPAPTPTPTPTPTAAPRPAPADSDHDGRPDATDRCPAEPAWTLDGCQLPYVTALGTKARTRAGRRYAMITVRTNRPATVRITVERKRGHRWTRVTRKVLVSVNNRAALKVKRLRKGRYRAVVVLSSGAGTAPAATKRFRVR